MTVGSVLSEVSSSDTEGLVLSMKNLNGFGQLMKFEFLCNLTFFCLSVYLCVTCDMINLHAGQRSTFQ